MLRMRLLVVEDDARLADQLRRGFRAEGYGVDVAGSVEDGRWLAVENPYDAVILDVALPDGDGIDLCADLRSAGRWAPIVMLTARHAVTDRVRGLDVGADDYVLKPFSFSELAARIRALVRRGGSARQAVLTAGVLTLDPASRVVTVAARRLSLPVREFALLDLLMRHQGDVLSRAEILDHVWDWAYEGSSNVIDWHVMSLRRRLSEAGAAEAAGGDVPRIETVRGVGYVLRVPATVPNVES
jgi:two-component system, OmpR family, response regulator